MILLSSLLFYCQKILWSRDRDLNPGKGDLQSPAWPLGYPGITKVGMAPRRGFEPRRDHAHRLSRPAPYQARLPRHTRYCETKSGYLNFLLEPGPGFEPGTWGLRVPRPTRLGYPGSNPFSFNACLSL
ncbi:MAG: hypothetical protein PWP39_1182 [Pyrococcus sp.]|nr:hypothetical protein [Pyrococcus sp.]